MKKLSFILVALLMAATVTAQNVDDKPAPQGTPSTALDGLRIANELVKYGYAKQSATALAQAAQMILENPSAAITEKPEGSQGGGELAPKQGGVSHDLNQILADAKEFADGNPTELKLIADVQARAASGHRGATTGRWTGTSTVRANTTDVWTWRFVGGQEAIVIVSGDGDTDLDLYIYDENGNLIEKDEDYTDDCVCTWYPKWTGTFKIKVKNRGSVYNNYAIGHN